MRRWRRRSRQPRGWSPAYEQHTAVDDRVGVILGVEGDDRGNRTEEIIEAQVDEVIATTNRRCNEAS